MLDSETAQFEQAQSTGFMNDTFDSINHETPTPNPVLDQLFGPQSDYLDFTSNLNVPQCFDTFPATENVISSADITNSKVRNAIMNQVICINVTMRHPRITNTIIADSDKYQIPTTTVLDNADIDGAIVSKCIIVASDVDKSDIADSTFINVNLIKPVFCPFQFLEPPISVQDHSMDSGVQNNDNITPDTSFETPGNAIPSLETENSSAPDMQGGDRNETHVAPQSSLNLLGNARGPPPGFIPETSSHEETYNEGHMESSTENATILPTAQSPIGTYATPISDCSTPCDKIATPSIRPKKRTRKKSTSQRKIRRLKEPESRVENINGTIFVLLQNCFDKEKDKNVTKQAREVQTVADYMIVNDCHALLQPQLKKWQKNLSSDKHALGFPPLEKSAAAAAKYFELLHSEGLLKYSLEHRMALVSFYLIYLEIAREMRDKDLGDYEPRSGDDRFATMANDKILATIHGVKIQSFSKEKIDSGRAKLNEFRRWGKRWWTLASGAGLGVLLVPSEQLAMVVRNEKFSMIQMNALITYIKAARPGCLSFFGSLEGITKAMMFGKLPDDLVQAVNEKESGLLGRATLIRVNKQDEMSLSSQETSNVWKDVKMESLLSQKAASFFNP